MSAYDTNSIEDAFRLLGLPTDATEDDIQRAYRELAKTSHPDAQGGDSAKQVALNDARDNALAYRRIKHAVIPINSRDLADALRDAIAPYTGISSAAKAQAIQRRVSRPINMIKWLSVAAASITGTLVLFRKELPIALHLDEQSKALFDENAALILLISGGLALVCQAIVSSQKQLIDSYMERIADKRQCAERLAIMLRYKDEPIITEHDFSSSSSLSIFLPDLRHVLRTKAIEHGLLKPVSAVS